MKNIIHKLSIYGLDASHPDGLHFVVGKTIGDGTISEILFMGDVYYKTGKRVYRIKISVPDSDDPTKGSIYTFDEIVLGDLHTVVVQNDTRKF